MDPGRQGRAHRGTGPDRHQRRHDRGSLTPSAPAPGTGRRLLRLVALKSLVEASGRVLNVALSLLGAHELGPAAWGAYWRAFSFASVVTLWTDLGGHLTVAREIAARPRGAAVTLAVAARVKAALTVAVLAALALTIWLRPSGPGLGGWLLAALVCLSWVEWLGYALRGAGRVIAESALLALTCALGFAFGAAVLGAGGGARGLAVSQLAAFGIVLAGAALWILRQPPFAGARGRVRAGDLRRLVTAAAPTGVAILLSLTSWRLGLLLLPRVWAGTPGVDEAAGFYAVAHRLLEAARFFPAMAAAALYPAFARREVAAAPRQAAATAAAVAVPVAALLTLPGVAPWLVTRLYGAAYADAAPTLTAIFWAYPLLAWNAVLTSWLVARGHVRLNAVLMAGHAAAHAAVVGAGPWLAGAFPGPAGPAETVALGLVTAEAVLAGGTLLAFGSLNRTHAHRV